MGEHTSHDQALAAAVTAAKAALRESGIPNPEVVLTVAWRERDWNWAMASKVPKRLRPTLAESLGFSLEDAHGQS